MSKTESEFLSSKYSAISRPLTWIEQEKQDIPSGSLAQGASSSLRDFLYYFTAICCITGICYTVFLSFGDSDWTLSMIIFISMNFLLNSASVYGLCMSHSYRFKDHIKGVGVQGIIAMLAVFPSCAFFFYTNDINPFPSFFLYIIGGYAVLAVLNFLSALSYLKRLSQALELKLSDNSFKYDASIKTLSSRRLSSFD